MVSVVGFDVGCYTSYIAVAKGGGIETIANEYSDRQTPTCVAFAGNRRLVGTSAKLQQATNVKNTLVNFTTLLGKKASDAAVIRERRHLPYRIEEGPGGRVVLQVNHNGVVQSFTPEQVLAMQLTKLKGIAESCLPSKVVDVVINVPMYYTDAERRAMLDASRIAGLNCVRLVNDLTAVGIAYGIYNTNLPAADQAPKHVAFVSVGYTSTQVTICAFNSGRMKVISASCDPQLGGRDFDLIIFDRLAREFMAKYNLTIADHPKAAIRLLLECEKAKKTMSANSQEIPINIECILDHELTSRIKRSLFEEDSAELLSRYKNVLQKCLSLAKLQPDEIHAVEMVGGSSRIPALKEITSSVFNQQVRNTLNADEAVARGCAFQAAICSPAFKVRDFSVTETCLFAITLQSCGEDGDRNSSIISANDAGEGKASSVEVFPFMHPIPSSRRSVFILRRPFTLEARYSDPEQLPNQNAIIGTFKVNGLPAKTNDPFKIRLKLRINSHGIFQVSQAELVEEYEKEVEVPDESVTPPPENGKQDGLDKPMDIETPANGDVVTDSADQNQTDSVNEQVANVPSHKKPPMKVVKKNAIRYKELPLESVVMEFNAEQINTFIELEGQLFEQDELEQKRAHAKNEVEEYVYEMRDKMQNALHDFATSKEQSDFSRLLNETEDWLYGDGEDLHRQAYVDRLQQMRSLGDPIELRAVELEARTAAVQNFEQSLVRIRKVLDSIAAAEDTYNHLTAEQVSQLQNNLTQHEGWLRSKLQVQNAKPKTENPTVLASEIISQQKTMEAVCHPIINSPKPTPPQPKESTEVKSENIDTAPTMNDISKSSPSTKTQDMDVD